MAVALIVAAGRGERLGSDRPKALVTLGGRPMLEWSVATLRSLRRDREDRRGAAGGRARRRAARGRSPSPAGRCARSRCARRCGPAGAGIRWSCTTRPGRSRRRRCSSARWRSSRLRGRRRDRRRARVGHDQGGRRRRSHGARTLDRPRLWAVQTPQVFRRAALERALLGADDELLAAATDDAWLIERAGGSGARSIPSAPAEHQGHDCRPT